MQFASKNSSILLPNSTLTELEASLFELTIVVVGDQPEVKESELWPDIHQAARNATEQNTNELIIDLH